MPASTEPKVKTSKIAQSNAPTPSTEMGVCRCNCATSIIQVPSTQPIHWTSYLSGLSTPVIAIFGAFIAYRQWITGRNKLKLDLFEKRYLIFEAARKVLAESTKHHKPKDEDLYPFISAVIGAKWLFNQEVADYLQKELWGKLIDLQTLTEELDGLNSEAERSIIVQKRANLRKQLWKEFDHLEKKLGPFLQLSH
jgi:hypothetical protein